MEREIICICCPLGCRLRAEINDKEINVTGNKCSRGINYCKEEIFAPKRVVTATCRTNSKNGDRLPVKTNKAVPKEIINSLLEKIYNITVNVPILRNEVVIKNFNNLDIDVVATKTIKN